LKPRCEVMVSRYLPAIRVLLSRELSRKHGLTEQRIAELLGTTKAAVSQYLSSKRGVTRVRELLRVKAVREEISKIAEELVKSPSRDTRADIICRLCLVLRKEQKILT